MQQRSSRRDPRLTAAGHEKAPTARRLSAIMSEALVGGRSSSSASMVRRSDWSSDSDLMRTSTGEVNEELSQSAPMLRPPPIQCEAAEPRPRGPNPGTSSRAKSWVRERVRKSSTELGSQMKRSSGLGSGNTNGLLSWARISVSAPRRRGRRTIAESPLEQAFPP